MKIEKTQRGFDITEFKDRYDNPCRLQHSSLATENAVWFGITDPNPQIMASQAAEHGIETEETSGWVDYPIPKNVNIWTEMHLTDNQLSDIIPYLIGFVETGRISKSDSWTPPPKTIYDRE